MRERDDIIVVTVDILLKIKREDPGGQIHEIKTISTCTDISFYECPPLSLEKGLFASLY